MNTTIEKKKILNFASNFTNIAQKEHWISHYDSDNDSLAIRTPKLSTDARKKYINDEFAFYVNRRNDVEGVFIEYFVTNFISHHKDFKDIVKELKSKGKEESVVELNKAEVKKIVPNLEAVLLDSIFPNNNLQIAKS